MGVYNKPIEENGDDPYLRNGSTSSADKLFRLPAKREKVDIKNMFVRVSYKWHRAVVLPTVGSIFVRIVLEYKGCVER